jgi:hypothetical protein
MRVRGSDVANLGGYIRVWMGGFWSNCAFTTLEPDDVFQSASGGPVDRALSAVIDLGTDGYEIEAEETDDSGR